MDYSSFDWSGGDIGDIEPYQLPKGSTAAGLGDMTSSILSKLGSGITGGLASTGAGMLAGLNPAMMGAQMVGQVAQAALGGPTTQTAGGKGGWGAGLALGGGDFNVNFRGTQTNQHTNPDNTSAGAGSGGPNYWLWGGAALVGLIALKMASR